MPDESVWTKLEKGSKIEQTKFFEPYESKFQSKPLSFEEGNVKKGDHIRCRGTGMSLYYHHALVKKVDENTVTLIENTGPVWGSAAVSQSTLGLDAGRLGGIVETTYSFSVLQEKKAAEILKWPKDLERFPAEEVIKRADSRIGENWYSVRNNNCEHFVTWCKCGLMVSLQVKAWLVEACEVICSLCNPTTIAKIIANIAHEYYERGPEMLESILERVKNVPYLKGIGPAFVLGLAIEIVLALYLIYKAYDQWTGGILIRTKEEFWIKVIGMIVKAILRYGLGYLGSKYSDYIIKTLGSCTREVWSFATTQVQNILNTVWGWITPSQICGAAGGCVGHLAGANSMVLRKHEIFSRLLRSIASYLFCNYENKRRLLDSIHHFPYIGSLVKHKAFSRGSKVKFA